MISKLAFISKIGKICKEIFSFTERFVLMLPWNNIVKIMFYNLTVFGLYRLILKMKFCMYKFTEFSWLTRSSKNKLSCLIHYLGELHILYNVPYLFFPVSLSQTYTYRGQKERKEVITKLPDSKQMFPGTVTCTESWWHIE